MFVFSHFRTFSDNLKLKKINSDVFRFFRVQKINSDVFRFFPSSKNQFRCFSLFSEFKKSIPTFFAFFRVQKINSDVSHFSELKKSISGRLVTFYPIIWSSGCFSSGHLFIWSNTFPLGLCSCSTSLSKMGI